MKVPEAVKSAYMAALKYRRVAFATCSKDGVPNTVPLGVGRFLDDETLIVIDNYFMKTRKNIEENPRAAVSFWVSEEKEGKVITKEGYQMKGTVTVQESGPLYDQMKAEIKAIRADFPVKAIVLMKVEEIYDVKAGPDAGKRIA
ncbi:MAG: pyridoxamine 5'-phosphate oxidase family protein [Candidatus Methanomethylicia archaeon]|nr:pyridoxamine 5'-phosphate oxidase family protein [Candidatus Methanomethylicia archaeon]